MNQANKIFEKVKSSFLEELESRLDVIHQEWELVRNKGVSACIADSSNPELVRLVHNLAGAASTFKLNQLCLDARGLETLLIAWFSGRFRSIDEITSDIDAKIKMLNKYMFESHM